MVIPILLISLMTSVPQPQVCFWSCTENECAVDPGCSRETKARVCSITAHFTVTRGAATVNMEIFPDASKPVRNDPPPPYL